MFVAVTNDYFATNISTIPYGIRFACEHRRNRFARSSAFVSTSCLIVPPFAADATHSFDNPDRGGRDVWQNALPCFRSKSPAKNIEMLRCHLRLSQGHQPLHHYQAFRLLEDQPAFGCMTELERLSIDVICSVWSIGEIERPPWNLRA